MISAPSKASADICKMVLVRHEHTDLAGTFCGHLDPPLSAHGRAQLDRLIPSLRRYPFRQVHSSDLRRARETAEAIAVPRHLPVQLSGALREISFGQWEGLSWKQIVARDPELAQRWLDEYPSVSAPGGEEFTDFFTRIQKAINDIAEEIGDGYAAVVTHAGVIRTILASVSLERDMRVDLSSCSYGSYWEIWRQQRRWVLRSCGTPTGTGLRDKSQIKQMVGHKS